MNNLTGKLAEAYECLSRASRVAYKDVYLISNQVLSKNPFTNNFLNNYLEGKRETSHSQCSIYRKLAVYYAKSLFRFSTYLLEFIEFYISRAYFHGGNGTKELIVLDTFFQLDRIVQKGEYSDPYLRDLDKVLRNLKKSYIYLPVFSRPRKAFELFYALKILKKQDVPFITEYQLISFSDLVRIIFFVFAYPFHVLAFRKTLRDDPSFGAQLLAFELIETLHYVTFYDYARFIQGKRIGDLLEGKTKIIGWCENQTIQKNFYRGCRECNPAALVYGAQLFLYSAVELNVIIDEMEEACLVVPDKILKNGASYIPGKGKLNYAVGPSLRYSKVFTTIVEPAGNGSILVLLPYYRSEAINILDLIKAVDLSGKKLIVKFHPAALMNDLYRMLPVGTSVVENDVYELFRRSKIVVSSISGTLLEAASLGIPAISVRNASRFEYNFFPDYGKGIVWDEVVTADELKEKINFFWETFEEDLDKRKIISDDYKAMFFCEPTVDKVVEAFDLSP